MRLHPKVFRFARRLIRDEASVSQALSTSVGTRSAPASRFVSGFIIFLPRLNPVSIERNQ
jgi:hypothetical protein